VLVLLIAVRLGSLTNEAQARTDVVSQTGDYTSLTLGADNDDVLVILDGRSENLAVYR